MKTLISRIRSDLSATTRDAAIDPLLAASRVLLYIILVAIIIGIVVTAALLTVHLAGNLGLFSTLPGDPAWRPASARVFSLIALFIAKSIVMHLLAMIGAVDSGETFAKANIARVEAIAANVVGLMILGTIARSLRTPVGPDLLGIDLDLALSPAGIAFALLLFVLARIFRQGAAIRADLEGTV